MKALTPLTSTELQRIASGLSERDRLIVTAVADLRYATTKQLERLYFTKGNSSSNARQARLTLRRLFELRVLHRLERRIGGVRAGSAGQIYSLDIAGQFVARRQLPDGRRRRPFEPSLAFVAHALEITELKVELVEAERRGGLELLGFEPEPLCWRYFFGAGGARVALKPDAFVRLGHGSYEELWFIEADRATHSSPALRRKFRTYRQYWASGREQARWGGVFPRVLWLAPTTARTRVLVDVAASQPPDSWKLFGVRPRAEALQVLTGETT